MYFKTESMMYEYNNKSLKSLRRKLRKQMTPAEIALWSMVRKCQIDGVRFFRQYSVDSYILDFYCPRYRLAIELDGAYHFSEERIEYDKKRTLHLESKNIRVLRFENFEVFDYPQRVLSEIKKHLYSQDLPDNLVQLY